LFAPSIGYRCVPFVKGKEEGKEKGAQGKGKGEKEREKEKEKGKGGRE